MRNPALDAWGDYDRDDPYPLFAQVQADGPVHQVTLADGHRAWLIVRHEEAKAALNHPGLSKDMHAALARDGTVVAEGLPGPAFARHMLSVDPPDCARLTSPAFTRPRIAALRRRVQAITDGLLDDLQARGDTVADLVKGFAFPLPFTVISELLGVPEPDRDQLGSWFTTLLTPSSALAGQHLGRRLTVVRGRWERRWAGSFPRSDVPAGRAAWCGLVAALRAGADGGVQVRPGERGGRRDAVDGGAEGAGDVDPGSFGVGGGPAGAPGQPGCPA